MKLKHFLFFAAAALFSLTACEEELIQDIGEPELTVSTKSVDFPAEGGSVTLVLKSNVDWDLKGYDDNKDWLTITPSSGEASDKEVTVTISALPNPDIDRSSIAITFHGNVLASKKVWISQKGERGDGLVPVTVAEFLEKKDTVNAFKLSGKVSGYNASYVSFDLVDETGSVYVYSVSEASKGQYADVLANGGDITIAGTYYWYAHPTDDTKSKVEIMKAEILDYDGPAAIDPEALEITSVADFLAAADQFTTCKLVGRVTSFNSSYVSFDLMDESGSVYVYSLDNASKDAYGETLKNGDLVTLLANYYWYEHATDPSKSKAEVMSAHIVSVEPLNVDNVETITIGDFLKKADTITPYQLTGKVSGFNATYCSFDLVDSTGKIYVYSVDNASKEEYGSVIENGGTLTIIGTYYWYEKNSKAEITGGTIVSYEAPEVVDPSTLGITTVADFLAAADATKTCKLKGTVTNFSATYCSFNLKDSTGSIYVYSLDAASKDKYASQIANGGTITITGTYYWYEHATDPSKSKAEIMNATVLEYTAGSGGGTTADAPAITVGEFLSKADSNTAYKLTGTVSNFNASYSSFDLVDSTGSIYVYSLDADSKSKYGSQLANGGTVTVIGTYTWYEHKTDPSKSKAEITNGVIVSYVAGSGGGTQGGDVDVSKLQQITCAQFNALSESDTNNYILYGEVTNILNTTYGNLYIKDDTGEVYIYGLLTASGEAQKFSSLDIAVGDKIKVYGKFFLYNGSTIEMKNATFISREKGSGGGTVTPGPDATAITVAEFLSKKDTSTPYQLAGTISNVGGTYKDFTLTDSTGSIYVYSLTSDSKSKYGDQLVDGATVTMVGVYYEYNGTPEIKNGEIVSVNGGTVGPVDPPTPPVVDPTYPEGTRILSFPDGNSESISAYTKTWTVTLDSFTWVLENFNNNKNAWAFVKCGRKGNDSTGTIYTAAPVDYKVSDVIVSVDALTASCVNSSMLVVAKDANFRDIVERTGVTLAKGDNSFKVSAPEAGCYYKLIFDCASHTANGVITISKVVYKIAE